MNPKKELLWGPWVETLLIVYAFEGTQNHGDYSGGHAAEGTKKLRRAGQCNIGALNN